MEYPFFLVDAFVRSGASGLSGNPAGVCILPSEQPAAWMQAVAAEINQAETAFLIKRADGGWQLRWFTPTVEVKLCGHATLAAAHVLWQQGESAEHLEFHSASGLLKARRRGDVIVLDFPSDPPQPLAEVPSELVQLLGTKPQWYGQGSEYLLAVVASAKEVCELQPDFALIAQFTPVGLIVTAPSNSPELEGLGFDMVSRFFAPNAGINEDSVTGSAHCTLAVYWGERLGKQQLRALQASPRSGELSVEWQGARVNLIGAAATRLAGVFYG